MLLVAQRVVTLRPPAMEGVNAFCYLHGAYTWLGEVPDEIAAHPGELVNSSTPVAPPGNRIRTYLDIYAPDRTASRQIRADVLGAADFIAGFRALPWHVNRRDTTFEFEADGALAPGALTELEFLLEHALAVRVPY